MKIKVISSQSLDTFEQQVNDFVELLEVNEGITYYRLDISTTPVAMTFGHSMITTEYNAFIYYEGEFQMEGAYC